MTVLDLLVIAYGSAADDPPDDSRFCGYDQRRVEVKLAPRVPARAAGNAHRIQDWATEALLPRVLPDVKHSQRWHCEFCGKLARESAVKPVSWAHLTPPKIVVYLHLVCDSQRGPCARQLREISFEMALRAGRLPPPPPFEIFTGHAIYPAAASCMKCNKDETIDQDLKRCARCKLVRYCGLECQREDWARHKENCKLVQDVKWVWP